MNRIPDTYSRGTNPPATAASDIPASTVGPHSSNRADIFVLADAPSAVDMLVVQRYSVKMEESTSSCHTRRVFDLK